MSTKRNTGLWRYLESRGLIGASPEALEAGRREYKNQYFREYKRINRKKRPEHTVVFNLTEYSQVLNASKKHGKTVSKFLKEATIAYIQGTVLVSEYKRIIKIGLVLSDIQNYIREIAESDTKSFWNRERDYQGLVRSVQNLEQEIRTVLTAPRSLTDVITEAIEENPAVRETLLSLLHSADDYKNPDIETAQV